MQREGRLTGRIAGQDLSQAGKRAVHLVKYGLFGRINTGGMSIAACVR
jgi:hypothetical protein